MGIIKFLWEDFKKDVKTFKALCSGKAKFAFTWTEFRENLGAAITENWMWFIIILFAFISGAFVSSQVYQYRCNYLIVETFYPWVLDPAQAPPGTYVDYNISILLNKTGVDNPEEFINKTAAKLGIG